MKFPFILALAYLAVATSCNQQQAHSHHDHDGHEEGLLPIAHTIWTDKSELFVEFEPLIAGRLTSFAAHFSSMSDFKAIEKGTVTASLIANGKGIKQTVDAPSSPGIFRPALQPKTLGKHQLVFDIQTELWSDKLIIDNVTVYADLHSAMADNPAASEGNEISFLKEQAWKIDFAITKATKQQIHQVIATSGKIKSDGIVLYNGSKTQIGNEVSANQTLFTLSGAGLTAGNLESQFAVSKAQYDKASADYTRAKALIKDQIISRKEFDAIKVAYQVAKTDYDNIVGNYGTGGQQIKAPFTGFVKNILVSEGQYVQAGEALAVITQNKKLMMQVDVSQKHFAALSHITSANFKTAYDPTVHTIEEFNGHLLSYGKTTSPRANYLPVNFELDNKGGLLPGAFVEVLLKTTPVKDALVVPYSAIMEDYENRYVYIQTAGESFEKRAVKIGVNDGINAQVLSGVNAGEWVVTTGAYQVKMASMSSTIPAHGHQH